MPRKLFREAFVILVETVVLLALLAVLGLPGRRSPKAEASVTFSDTLQPQASRARQMQNGAASIEANHGADDRSKVHYFNSLRQYILSTQQQEAFAPSELTHSQTMTCCYELFIMKLKTEGVPVSPIRPHKLSSRL